MSERPPPAAPAAGSLPDATPASSVPVGRRLLHAAAAGLVAALALAASGLVIAVVEYVASGQRYRPWTWVKVAILYALAFCGTGVQVIVRAGALAEGSPPLSAAFRLPLILGAVAFVALLVRAGRGIVRDGESVPLSALAAAAAVVGAALPLFLASFAVSLRFPEVGDAVVTPIRWQAALFPLVVATASTGAGAYAARGERVGGWGTRPMSWVGAGWRMFVTAMALAFIGFLIVATLSPGWTGRYASAARGAGRTGAVAVLHHLLLLPAQTMLSVAPALGGEVHVSVEGEAEVTTISLRAIHPSRSIGELGGVGGGAGPVPLGGAWYAFLLVPVVATVAGGRRAGRSGRGVFTRATDGAASGAVFCLLVVGGCAFATAVVPFLGLGLVPVRISAPIGATAALALGWGVVGGAVGAMAGEATPADQMPVPDPAPGGAGPESLTSL
jgi:hypothetical protein